MSEKIPNRFKKTAEHQKVKPGGTEPIPQVEETVTPPPATEEPVVTTNFLASKLEPKDEGKTVGFYLSTEAIKKIDKLAKQLKCSKSKALDTLIRNTIE